MRNKLIFVGVALVVLIGTLFMSCKEKDVPFAVDEDEIIDYINEVPTAYELYRIEGLVNGKGYQLPWDTATHYDTLLSSERNVDFLQLTPHDESVYVEPYGEIRIADVRVRDVLTIQTTRRFSIDSAEVDTNNMILMRQSRFLKLGSDAMDFLGWWMSSYDCGYNLDPVLITFTRFDGSLFRPKSSYAIHDIDTVVPASKLTIRAIKTSLNEERTFQTISGIGRDSVFTLPLVRQNNSDTALTEFNVSRSDSLYRDIYLINSYRIGGLYWSKSWVLPVQL